jgi:hypothetical protein
LNNPGSGGEKFYCACWRDGWVSVDGNSGRRMGFEL